MFACSTSRDSSCNNSKLHMHVERMTGYTVAATLLYIGKLQISTHTVSKLITKNVTWFRRRNDTTCKIWCKFVNKELLGTWTGYNKNFFYLFIPFSWAGLQVSSPVQFWHIMAYMMWNHASKRHLGHDSFKSHTFVKSQNRGADRIFGMVKLSISCSYSFRKFV